MNVKVGWPQWIDDWAAADNNMQAVATNDATKLTNVMKIYLTASTTPVADFYGFFVPHGVPFMKSTGKNEIEAVSTRTGVKCYMYG